MPGRILTYRRRERPFIFLGALCFLAGLSGFADPGAIDKSIIASALGVWSQRLWLACYLIGGMAVLAGTLWPRRARAELEVFGLWAILGGMSVNGVVVLGLRGPVAASTTLLSIVFASWMIQGRLQDLQIGLHEPLERRSSPRWDRRKGRP